MKKTLIVAAAAGLLSLTACNNKSDAADNVQANAENTADVIDNQADMVRDNASNAADAMTATADNKADALENKADAVRDAGDNKADAMDKHK